MLSHILSGDYGFSRALQQHRMICCYGFAVGASPRYAILLHGSAMTGSQSFSSTDAKYAGSRIKMSAPRLQQQSLRPGTDSVLLRCLDNGGLIGHAFATRWDIGEKKVCWVTQLCVRRSHRRLGVATEVSALNNFWKTAVSISHDLLKLLPNHPHVLLSAFPQLRRRKRADRA